MATLRQRRPEPSPAESAPPAPAAYDDKLKTAAAGESKLSKMLKRSVVGLALLGLFTGLIRLGPIAMCVSVFVAQVMLFRELTNVRYKAEKSREVPFFRTVQWVWFAVAMFYAYGNSITEYFMPMGAEQRYLGYVSFGLYWATFIVTVLSFKKGHYKYQMGQLTWTVVCLALVVGQLMSVVHNILIGMFWFVFPMSLVIFNDCSAYFCGLLMGRKLIKVPFLPLSPNKTWEGFIGAAAFTVVFGFWFPVFLSQFELLTCPAGADPCELPNIFRPAVYDLPVWLLRVTGQPRVTLLPIQLHGIAFGAFASLVAPFGGFFASAIKRAYEIKDFDNIIPGHGGLMDRFDCQFLMQLCSSVHYRTFVEAAALSLPFVLRLVDHLDRSQQEALLRHSQSRLAGP